MITAADARKISEDNGLAERIKEFCDITDKQIEKASKRGYSYTMWEGGCYMWEDIEERLMKIYEDRGFKFRRTPPIGGVTQNSVELYW